MKAYVHALKRENKAVSRVGSRWGPREQEKGAGGRDGRLLRILGPQVGRGQVASGFAFLPTNG